MANLTPLHERQQETQDFLNAYIAAERFLKRQVKREGKTLWQEPLARTQRRIETLRQQLCEDSGRDT